jgi:excisionase family DNA binding protein
MSGKKLMDERFLSTKEVAKKFGASTMTIDRWCQEGKLPYTKIGGKRLFPESALEKVLQDNLRKAI